MKSCRFYLILIIAAGLASHAMHAQTQSLLVERQGNLLRVTAPQMHFLEGRPLEQLHNGASVTYVFDLSIIAGGRSVFDLRERFIISYDLWEEKFSAVQAGPSGNAASHLTAAAAESWCLQNLKIPAPALSPDKPFVVRLELSVADERDNSIEGGTGLTLAGLIDIFSRKQQEKTPHWEASSGPLRLSNLKVSNGNGQKGKRQPGS